MKSRPNHRRAVRVIASFAVSFITLCVASEIWLRADGENYIDLGYSVRRDHLTQRIATMRQEDSATPLVIMVGSSRVHNGLDARAAEEQLRLQCGRPVCVTNFGVPGGGPMSSMVTLGRLLREGVKPDLLLIEVMPIYLKRCDVQLTGATPLSKADHQWLQQYGVTLESESQGLLSLHSKRTGLLRTFVPKLLPRGMNPVWVRKSDSWGAYLLADNVDPVKKVAAHAEVEKVFGAPLRDFELSDADLEGLRMVLTACRERKIAAALVLTPEGPYFRSLYRDGARQKLLSQFEQLAAEYGAALVPSWEWLEEDDFLDSHHMLARGAHKFTERLCRETVSQRLRDLSQFAQQPASTPLHR